MSNDPRIHKHTFVNGRCEVCSFPEPDAPAWTTKPVTIKGTAVRAAVEQNHNQKAEGRWRDKIEDTLDKTSKAVDSANSKLVFILIFTSAAWISITLHGCK